MEWKLGSRRHFPTTQELLCFDAAARCGSFTRAAEELALTQSAVSKQISSLEARLSVRLFDRLQKQVVLTDTGRMLKNQVADILAQIDHSIYAITTHCDETVLRVAVLPTLATRWMLPRIPLFLAKQPGIALDFTTRLTQFDFRDEPFDCAIQYGEAVWPAAQTTVLFREDMVPVASPGYREQVGLRCDEDLQRATLIQHRLRPHLWKNWFSRFGIHHRAPTKGCNFDQFSMVIEAAAVGLGLGLIPQFMIEDELRSGRLVVVASHRLRTEHSYYVAVPQSRLQDTLTMGFVGWLVNEAGRVEVPAAAPGASAAPLPPPRRSAADAGPDPSPQPGASPPADRSP
jgi:LysR family transcriptional regulator, glycine cleavage system transcriptional activator